MPRLLFPPGFIWGTATSAHQTEGNNVASDHWAQETAPQPPSRVEVVSGDTCDSYHRYPDDIALVADAGLTHYRFSIEWARIEPAEGVFLRGQIDHYGRMITECLRRGVQPIVTLNHATVPAWLGRLGSWDHDRAPELFERYVRTITPILRDVPYICTINEPNMSAIHDGGLEPDYPGGLPPAKEPYASHLFEAHRRAREVLKASLPEVKVGWTVGCQGFHLTEDAGASGYDYCWSREWRYLEAARDDDFIGVQNYSTVTVGPNGPVPASETTWTNMLGWQLSDDSLAKVVVDAHRRSGVPVLITEHGLATADDAQRIEYTARSLAQLHDVIEAGTPVLGYVYWSLLDNYEWGSYEPLFGLVHVDLDSFEREPKPSLAWLGRVARDNAVDALRAETPTSPRPIYSDKTQEA